MRGWDVSPWAQLNLRWNPFGEPPSDAVSGLIVLPEEGVLVEHLRRPCAVVQFLGDAGRGKTARLRKLQAQFPGSVYVYLGEDEPLPGLPRLRTGTDRGPKLLLDEAQRLPRRRRAKLFRSVRERATCLVIASHEDLAGEMEREKLEVLTITVRGLDEDRLAGILRQRIEWARLGPGSVPTPSLERIRHLIGRYGDDLRSMLDQLYEDYQDLLIETDEERRSWRSAI